MNSGDDMLLIHAALDGELDAAGMLQLERRLAQDPALAADYGRMRALHEVIRGTIAKPMAPAALRQRVSRLAHPSEPRVTPAWRAMAASAVLAAGLASVTTWLATSSTQETASLTQTLIADHKRGLLSGQPVDIASSDRHTVKPWFDSHFALAPQVVDLGTEGFPLAGGRIEVIGGQPVPTLVYRRREHLISLTALPAGTLRSPGTQTVEGYSILGWRMGETDYWAVSNLDPSELEKFRQAFETAIKGG